MDFPGGSDNKESASNAGDLGSVPGLGRSPREGHGNLPQYSCLENPMDRSDWWATVPKSRTQLSDLHLTLTLHKWLIIGFGFEWPDRYNFGLNTVLDKLFIWVFQQTSYRKTWTKFLANPVFEWILKILLDLILAKLEADIQKLLETYFKVSTL